MATDRTSALLPKPVHPSEATGLVDRLPLTPRPTWPGRCGAHTPIALGEVEKLCLIEQGTSSAELELDPIPRPWPVTITAEVEDHTTTALASILRSSPEVREALRVLISAVLLNGFELIEPPKT